MRMMWFDDDKHKSFETIVREGATYHKNKYGKLPSRVFVSRNLAGIPEKVDNVSVSRNSWVIPNHYFFEVENENKQHE